MNCHLAAGSFFLIRKNLPPVVGLQLTSLPCLSMHVTWHLAIPPVYLPPLLVGREWSLCLQPKRGVCGSLLCVSHQQGPAGRGKLAHTTDAGLAASLLLSVSKASQPVPCMLSPWCLGTHRRCSGRLLLVVGIIIICTVLQAVGVLPGDW